MSKILNFLFSPDSVAGRLTWVALVLRVAAGVIFVLFGVDKFIRHESEVDSFTNYGLPWPEVFVYAIGVVELVGGVFLIKGLYTRATALVIAGDMVGAILLSGIGEGEQISLTLAPALLVVMLFLLWSGAGMWSLDRRRELKRID